jgi:hypothetical protein
VTGRPIYDGELTGLDADGEMLREWDGVVLARSLPATEIGNCETLPGEIPVGTRATVIEVLDAGKGIFKLECYLDEAGETFAFTQGVAADVRVTERIEDKKDVEI